MKCPECNGKGFKEFEHGLIMVGCLNCESTGVIDESSVLAQDELDLGKPEYSIFPGVIVEEEASNLIITNEVAVNDTVDSGAGEPDATIGSPDTSEPKQPKKRKAKKRSRKKSG
jgi:hypothetical protein